MTSGCSSERGLISTLAAEIELKTSRRGARGRSLKALFRIGELSVDLANQQQAIESSGKKLEDDSKLLADGQQACARREKELKRACGCAVVLQDWRSRSKSRAEELVAIQETLSLLQNEEALLSWVSYVGFTARSSDLWHQCRSCESHGLMELDEVLERIRKGEELWPQLIRAQGWKERLPRVAESLRKSSLAIPGDVAEQLVRCISEMTVSEPVAERKVAENI